MTFTSGKIIGLAVVLSLLLLPAAPQRVDAQTDAKLSRAAYTLKDQQGHSYSLYLIGAGEQQEQVSANPQHDWAIFGNEGDLLYHANYTLYLQKQGSPLLADTGIRKDNYTYNATGQSIYTLPMPKGQADLLFITEYAGSSAESADLYRIENGTLRKLNIYTYDQAGNEPETAIFYTKRPRKTAGNRFETAAWSNADAEWVFSTYEVVESEPAAYLREVKRDIVNREQGDRLTEKWKKDWK